MRTEMRSGIDTNMTASIPEQPSTPSAPELEAYARLSVQGAPLRIARLQERTLALGPGARGVVWFQGCSLTCRGCIAASMNAAPPRVLTTPALLADWCVALQGIDGITVSGGDPFDQPPSDLAEFLESIRRRSTLSILVFTGRTLDQLHRHPDPAVARCLSAIDILVDGPYVEELNDGVGWRGSSNQVIHALGQRSSGSCEGAIAPRRVELMVTAGGRVSFTGIPTRGRGEAIAARLQPATDEESTKKADTETTT